MTCSRRWMSIETTRTSAWASTRHRCLSVVIWKRFTTRLTSVTSSAGSWWSCSRPACSLVTSRRSSVNSPKRPADWRMPSRDSCWSAVKTAPLSRADCTSNSCANPCKTARGLRNSCAAMAIKSSFNASASFKAETSWYMTRAAGSCREDAVAEKFKGNFCVSRAMALTNTGNFEPSGWRIISWYW